MGQRDISSMRSTIEFLKEQNEIFVVEGEVDPIYEISGIQAMLESGPALLFNNIRGYPKARNVGNVFSTRDRVAKIFDVADSKSLTLKCREALNNPIPPRVVEDAPCQEVLITEDIDVAATLPIIKHSERDGAHVLGGGNIFVSGSYYRDGTELTFKRLSFRGKDWASMLATMGTHLGYALDEHKRVPLTINICTPPAVNLVAAAGPIHIIVPYGSDELGIAGGLQGFPVDICRAKTVDAHAIANSEWVLEGYLSIAERVWETEEAEKIGEAGVAPFMPEWAGYLGRALRLPKFQVTAITHRKDKPIFFTPLARSFEGNFMGIPFRAACFYELAQRLVPGFVVDVNILTGLGGYSNVVFQVRKRNKAEDGTQRNILTSALGVAAGLRLAVAVDDDVDIYSADDVLWAITTRVKPENDIIMGGGGRMLGLMPVERFETDGTPTSSTFLLRGGMGFDATVPFGARERFERAHYPVDKIDLSKWFSEAQIASVKASQSDYVKFLAATGR